MTEIPRLSPDDLLAAPPTHRLPSVYKSGNGLPQPLMLVAVAELRRRLSVTHGQRGCFLAFTGIGHLGDSKHSPFEGRNRLTRHVIRSLHNGQPADAVLRASARLRIYPATGSCGRDVRGSFLATTLVTSAGIIAVPAGRTPPAPEGRPPSTCEATIRRGSRGTAQNPYLTR